MKFPVSRSLSVVASVVLAIVGTACGSPSSTTAGGSGPVKVGVITAISGPGGAYGPPIIDAAKLAIDRINAGGGVLGRQLQLELGDDASDVKTGTVTAERLLTKDKVSVLVGMEGSNIRDAILPIVNRTGAPYIYVPLYEGGACSPNMFELGEVPPDYNPAISYIQQTLGGTSWYFVGSDYTWAQKTNVQMAKFVTDAGGQVLGQTLVPYGTNDFAEVLNKVKSSGAKHILATTVGTDSTAFIKGWHSFGLSSSTDMTTLALADNQLSSLGADVAGVYGVYGYFNGLDSPQNHSFLATYASAFGPQAPVQTSLSEGVYDGIWLWKLAVEKAGNFDPKSTVKAMGGITFSDAPRGAITVDAKTHHVAQHIHLVQAHSDGTYHLVKDFGQISPGPQCSF